MSYQFLQLSDTMLCERITHYTARIDSNQDLYICFFFLSNSDVMESRYEMDRLLIDNLI